MITLGIAAVEQTEWPPFGKQRFYFEDILTVAEELPLRFFFFSPIHWEYGQDNVSGYMVENGQWTKCSMPLPYLIYDRAFSSDATAKEKLKTFRNYLRHHPEHQVLNPVDMGFLLDDKVAFHQFLGKYKIPTLDAEQPLWLLYNADFSTTTAYYLKPISGSGGLGIYVLAKDKDGFSLSNHISSETQHFQSIADALDHLSKTLDLNNYFVQSKAAVIPYQQQPYDLRVLIQNHSYNDYHITGMALRMGQQGSNVSNLQAGGTALPLEALSGYFEQHFGRSWEEEIAQIHQLSADCCQALHKNFGNFLEIGLDFLLTTDRGPILMEGNTRPSRWIFNVLADNFAAQPDKAAFYKNLRTQSVLVPALFTLACG